MQQPPTMSGSPMQERWLKPGAEYYTPPGSQASSGPLGEKPPDPTTTPSPAEAGDIKSLDERHAGGGSRPLRFFPFGLGARECVGQGLAKLNYTATLATLLGYFHFKLAPEVMPGLRAWQSMQSSLLIGRPACLAETDAGILPLAHLCMSAVMLDTP